MKEITIYAPASELLENVINEITKKVPSFVAIGVVEMDFLKATVFCDEKDAEYVTERLATVAPIS